MQFDVNRFLSGHPEVQPMIEQLEKDNAHFAKLLQKYYDLAHEIGRSESDDVPEAMEDLALDQKKKERLEVKDELIEMLQKQFGDKLPAVLR